MSRSAPLPRSSTTSAPCRWAAAATARASGASTKPAWLKFDGWTRRTRRARPSASTASKSAARVRFVVPTSTSFAPGTSDDLGDPDAATDLDELPAAHRDAAPARQADRERDGRGVVDDDQRVLGAGQRDQVRLGLAVAAATTTRLAVELEEDRPLGRRARGLDRRPRPRRAAEVGVDDDARGIDHALGSGAALEGLEAGDDLGAESPRACGRSPASPGPPGARAPRPRRRAPSRGRRPGLGRRSARGPPPARVPRSGDAARRAARSSGDHRRPGERRWRERMGVEPTARRRAPRHRF